MVSWYNCISLMSNGLQYQILIFNSINKDKLTWDEPAESRYCWGGKKKFDGQLGTDELLNLEFVLELCVFYHFI